MDQTACAAGGLIGIDFKDPDSPLISPVDFDLKAAGYVICIVNTGGSHAGLTAEYASIPAEMRSVAREFGQETLRGISSEDILGNISSLRSKTSDRAILRALHFTEENERVKDETDALMRKDLDAFFALIRRSGDSSFKYLQNIYTNSDPLTQSLSVALAATDIFLGSRGAFRVHGGGFAGTIQAFVPEGLREDYRALMDNIFGEGSCLALGIRDKGPVRIQ
jgi:galactokinase